MLSHSQTINLLFAKLNLVYIFNSLFFSFLISSFFLLQFKFSCQSVSLVHSYEVATTVCHCTPCNKLLIFKKKNKLAHYVIQCYISVTCHITQLLVIVIQSYITLNSIENSCQNYEYQTQIYFSFSYLSFLLFLFLFLFLLLFYLGLGFSMTSYCHTLLQ